MRRERTTSFPSIYNDYTSGHSHISSTVEMIHTLLDDGLADIHSVSDRDCLITSLTSVTSIGIF